MQPTAPAIRALISTPLTFHRLRNAPPLLFFSATEAAKTQSAAPWIWWQPDSPSQARMFATMQRDGYAGKIIVIMFLVKMTNAAQQ